MCFGDRNKGNVRRIAPGDFGRTCNARVNIGKAILIGFSFPHRPAIGSAMQKRHSSKLPRLWLMTDERMGEALLPSIRALPRGSGVIFRHYKLPRDARRTLLERVRRAAARKRLVLLEAGKGHGRHRGAVTAPVHNIRERIAAERAGAQLLFVSPVFETASHRGAKPLGRVKFGILVRGARCPVVALGGMNTRRARALSEFGIYGWAGIDALRR
jgi:thiamine-phosphate pyrophosphorylase